MQFPDEVRADVTNRLRRLEGQIRGVQRMIDDGEDCHAVITQLSACKSALDRVSYRLIAGGMRHCATQPDGGIDVEELERLFVKIG